MVAIGTLGKLWIGYNSIIGKVDHLNDLQYRVSNIIEQNNNIVKYGPQIYYETRIKSLNRITQKIQKKGTFPKDIYGLRIVYNTKEKNNEFLSYYIKYCIDEHFGKNLYFKDYISTPKNNGYRSLHFGILDQQCLFDIQVRNIEMDYWAKKGGAKDYHSSTSSVNPPYIS